MRGEQALLIETSLVKNPLELFKIVLSLWRRRREIIYLSEPAIFKLEVEYNKGLTFKTRIVAGTNSIIILEFEEKDYTTLLDSNISCFRVRGPTWFRGRRLNGDSATWNIKNNKVRVMVENTGLSRGGAIYILEHEGYLVFSKGRDFVESEVGGELKLRGGGELSVADISHPIVSGLDFRTPRIHKVSKPTNVEFEVPLLEAVVGEGKIPVLTFHPRTGYVKLYSLDVFDYEDFASKLLVNILSYIMSEEGNFKV